jgi:hypothetical protein
MSSTYDNSESEAEHAASDMEELLKRPSTLPDVQISLRSFEKEDQARELGNTVGIFLRLFGTFLDLERLDAITIAFDYEDALAEVDLGVPSSAALTPTRDEFATGIAMAVTVIRDGRPKAHLVLDANFLMALTKENDPNFQLAVYVICHEAAHIHDLAYRDRAFPGVILQQKNDFRDGVLLQIATICWEEYVASRLSAPYASAEQLGYFESTFCSALEGVRERGNHHIRKYRWHADVMQLAAQMVSEYGALLKYAAYLDGHTAGLNGDFAQAAPKASELTRTERWFMPTAEALHSCLALMWASYGRWSGLEVYDPLKEVAHGLLKAGGVDIQQRPQGAYISVPFTPDTMPL